MSVVDEALLEGRVVHTKPKQAPPSFPSQAPLKSGEDPGASGSQKTRRFTPPSRHAGKRPEKLDLHTVSKLCSNGSPSPNTANGSKLPRKSVSFEFPLRPEVLNYPKEEKPSLKGRIKGLNKAVKRKWSRSKSKLASLSTPERDPDEIQYPNESYHKKEEVDDVIEQICVSEQSSKCSSLRQFSKRKSSANQSKAQLDKFKISKALSSKTHSSEDNLSTQESCTSRSSFGRRSWTGLFHKDFLAKGGGGSPLSKRPTALRKAKKPFQSIKKIISKGSPRLTHLHADNPYAISRSYDDILRESNFPTQDEYFQDFCCSDEVFQAGDFDDDENYYNMPPSRRASAYSLTSGRRPSLYYDQPSRRLSAFSYETDYSYPEYRVSPRVLSTENLEHIPVGSNDLSDQSSPQKYSSSQRKVTDKLSVVRETSAENRVSSPKDARLLAGKTELAEFKIVEFPLMEPQLTSTPTTSRGVFSRGRRNSLECGHTMSDRHSFINNKFKKIKARIGLFRSQSDFGPLPNKPPPPKPPRMHQVFTNGRTNSLLDMDLSVYFRRFSLVDGNCDKLSAKATTLTSSTGYSIQKFMGSGIECGEIEQECFVQEKSPRTNFPSQHEHQHDPEDSSSDLGFDTLERKYKNIHELSLSKQIEIELRNMKIIKPFPVYYPPISPSKYQNTCLEPIESPSPSLSHQIETPRSSVSEFEIVPSIKDVSEPLSDDCFESMERLAEEEDDNSRCNLMERKKSLISTFFERLVEQQKLLQEDSVDLDSEEDIVTPVTTPDTSDSDLMICRLFEPEENKRLSLPSSNSSSYMKFNLKRSDYEIIFFPGMRSIYQREIRVRRSSDTALLMRASIKNTSMRRSVDSFFDGYSADTEEEGLVSHTPVS